MRTRAEGEAILKELRLQQILGPPPAKPEEQTVCALTVAEAIRLYIESRRESGNAPSTVRRYEGNLKIVSMAAAA